jgi:hypothetical protein
MDSTRILLCACLSALLVTAFLACQTPEERQADLKKSRMERVWSVSSIKSLKGTTYPSLLDILGEPSQKKWYNPGFGVVVYDSLKIRSEINGDVRLYSIILTFREHVVTEYDIL